MKLKEFEKSKIFIFLKLKKISKKIDVVVKYKRSFLERIKVMLIDKVKEVKITDKITVGNGKIFLIAGPCVIESEDLVMEVAKKMKKITDKLGIN